MFAQILACLDGSVTGEPAGKVAIEMASRFHGGLTLVTVLPARSKDSQSELETLIPKGPGGRALQQTLEEVQAAALEKGASSAEIVYLWGNPADAILEHVAKATPDLIVVGTRGLSRGSRMLLGSVSSRLVTEAPCPVLVVRNLRPKGSKST